MNFSLPAVAVLMLFVIACKPGNTDSLTDKEQPTHQDTVRSEEQFFPVESFLRNEIEYVDSLPVGIKKYRTIGNRTDSAYIDPAEFHRLATEFLPPQLKDSALKAHFKESSFFDRSTNYATFLYTAADVQSPLRRIDVVTAKGDVYDEVKSLYMEKNISAGKANFIKKLMWKPKRHFQIITISTDSASANQTEQIKVVWDNRE